ncbi:MAG: pentapeptide repeat-containing protein [Ktedonobacteraceae bacterium]
MANQKHLDILKQGVEVWNQWRYSHQRIRPDLTGADFSRVNLSGVDFNKAKAWFKKSMNHCDKWGKSCQKHP